ncbi:carboxypeptidase inhibitor SmCI-like [Periophthalmus magnuspinnatus]|uniref:carboxypeptidase inhibitor SmCI-like n=1 Tax=Periophthalmus magnuspinnatus TaxID=409849 RepID=UPI0024373978|nr:carboxypeptidase inhibitor SmCI-like [Periophthalmus magnuspinnatus]
MSLILFVKTPDFCKLMPEPGPGPSCLAYIPQFFYNSTLQECEEFTYGGCGERPNRICNLPPETGPCKVYFSRHFYNTTSGKCEIFIYGCCQGNLNRFKSLRTC